MFLFSKRKAKMQAKESQNILKQPPPKKKKESKTKSKTKKRRREVSKT